MNYITLIIICVVIIVIGALVLIYLMHDEKKLKEVDNSLLEKLGKLYTKEEFEKEMFNMYTNIVNGIQNENYNYLRDVVADLEYNKILLSIKENSDKNIKEVTTDIKKGFSKLISFRINSDLEVAKLWVQYTDKEYTTQNREVEDEEGNKQIQEVIIKGDKNKDIYHEYILTFVKGRSNNEDILCPNCGYHTKLLNTSKCIRCDSIISPKKMHWVYTSSVTTNISKNK